MWRSSEDIHDKYCQEENGDFLPQRRTSSMAMSLVAAGLRTFNLFAGPWHQAGLAIQPEPANPPSASSCFPVFFNRFLGSTIRLVARHPSAASGDQAASKKTRFWQTRWPLSSCKGASTCGSHSPQVEISSGKTKPDTTDRR